MRENREMPSIDYETEEAVSLKVSNAITHADYLREEELPDDADERFVNDLRMAGIRLDAAQELSVQAAVRKEKNLDRLSDTVTQIIIENKVVVD